MLNPADLSALQAICVAVMIGALVWESYVDFQEMILPDPLTFAVFLSGMVVITFDPLLTTFETGLAGAAGGFFVSWLLREIVYWIKREEALGFGDVKLFGAAGLWVGAEGVISVAFYGALLTILLMLGRKLLTKKGTLKDVIPFGPGIAAGLVIVLFTGPISGWLALFLM